MKRTIAVILALCMAFGLGVNAFAVNITPELNREVIRQGQKVTVTISLSDAIEDVKFLETRIYYNPNIFGYPEGKAPSTGEASKFVLGAAARTEENETYATLNYIDETSQGQDFAAGTVYTLEFTALKPFLVSGATQAIFGFKMEDNEAVSGAMTFNGGQIATASINIDYSEAMASVSGTFKSFGEATEMKIELVNAESTVVDTFTSTEKTGTYSLENIEPGDYTLKVSKARHVTREYPLTVDTDDLTQDVEIWLLGDVSGNGEIGSEDSMQIGRYINGKSSMIGNGDANNDYRMLVADVSGTMGIGSEDSMQIKRYINGKSSMLS